MKRFQSNFNLNHNHKISIFKLLLDITSLYLLITIY